MKYVSLDEFNEAVEGSLGWCEKCEEFTRDSTEPDAVGYECPNCGNNSVTGAENALIAGVITLEGD
jgi:Zn finger protein HypA/HybF involved in hydrogenase expression